MSALNPETIVKNVSKIASLPQIYLKVDELLGKQNTTNAMLATVIEGDPALTAKILQITNSAFYGCTAQVESVKHAINVLGTQQLRDLILACSALTVFKDIPNDLFSMENFWKHCIGCGVAARCLAIQVNENNVERFFVGGLLHDIGRLVLLVEMPDTFLPLIEKAKTENRLLYEVETQELGFDHGLLGGLLLKNWKLSPRLYEGVSYHHCPQKADRYPIESAIIHLADIIVNALGLGHSGGHLVPPLNADAWQIVNLKIDCFDDFMPTLLEQYHDAIRFILDSTGG